MDNMCIITKTNGDKVMANWLESNFDIPAESAAKCVEGRIIIQILVNRDSTVKYPKISRGLQEEVVRDKKGNYSINKDKRTKDCELLESHLVEVLEGMPKMKPGKTYYRNGVYDVNSELGFIIEFKINKYQNKKCVVTSKGNTFIYEYCPKFYMNQ